MQTLLFLTIILRFGGLTATDDHAVYLSTVALAQGPDVIRVTIKVFEDDLRDAIRHHSGLIIDHRDDRFEGKVEDYFRDHFAVDNEMLKVSQVEMVGDSYVIEGTVSVYLHRGMSLKADYFMEIFPGQKNIMTVEPISEIKEYIIFERGSTQRDW